MKIILDCPEETIALHIVAVTRATWPNIKLLDVSVPTDNLIDGNTISITKPQKEEEHATD